MWLELLYGVFFQVSFGQLAFISLSTVHIRYILWILPVIVHTHLSKDGMWLEHL